MIIGFRQVEHVNLLKYRPQKWKDFLEVALRSPPSLRDPSIFTLYPMWLQIRVHGVRVQSFANSTSDRHFFF
jgi:hypothetical protein